jgi:hypothetical protein
MYEYYFKKQTKWLFFYLGLIFNAYTFKLSTSQISFLHQNQEKFHCDAVRAAEGLLGGADKVTTPLWWDKN